MSNRTYDCIKNFALVCSPVLVFLTALVSIWNIPYAAEITDTLAALDTLACAIVLVAKKIYDNNQKGES